MQNVWVHAPLPVLTNAGRSLDRPALASEGRQRPVSKSA
jgi:hypothetical protein